jgi:hypothetical protein
MFGRSGQVPGRRTLSGQSACNLVPNERHCAHSSAAHWYLASNICIRGCMLESRGCAYVHVVTWVCAAAATALATWEAPSPLPLL